MDVCLAYSSYNWCFQVSRRLARVMAAICVSNHLSSFFVVSLFRVLFFVCFFVLFVLDVCLFVIFVFVISCFKFRFFRDFRFHVFRFVIWSLCAFVCDLFSWLCFRIFVFRHFSCVVHFCLCLLVSFMLCVVVQHVCVCCCGVCF